MATFGQIRHIVEQRYPGVSADLRDHYIKERYRSILDECDWDGLHVSATLQTTAVYEAGTVTLTNGSTTVTGASTTFTSAMTGRDFRAAGDEEYYGFTYVSATSGTLSRAYEGTTNSELTYKIFQRVYELASDVDVLESIKRFDCALDMDIVSRERLDEMAPGRPLFGKPNRYALSDFDADDDPTVELYPIPDESWGLPYRYTKRPADLSSVSDVIEKWISVRCLTEGAMSDLALIAGKEQAASAHSSEFVAELNRMIGKESRRRGGRQLEMADRFVRHRRRRGAYV